MLRVVVIGCGLQGLEIARDLAKDTHVAVCDIDKMHLNQCRKYGITDLHQLDIHDTKRLYDIIKKYDVVVGAVPSKHGFKLVTDVIKAGKNMVDISFMPEDALKLDVLAKKYKVKVVVDCGLAPGISNMLVGHAAANLKRIDEIHIAVGGLPQNPKPPLNYRTVFYLPDVIEEYTRKVTVILNGKAKIVEPLTGLEKISFKGVGDFEYFLTDGLRSLAKTIKNVGTMVEKTIRYPGHTSQIKTLIECGFFDTKPMSFCCSKRSPRDFALAVLRDKLALGKDKDITFFRVVIKGERNLKYEMVDRFTNGVTSMARTTGYPCAIVARLMDRINNIGIIPPEELGKDNGIFDTFIRELNKRGVKIKEQIL